jgi:hypothetical protein
MVIDLPGSFGGTTEARLFAARICFVSSGPRGTLAANLGCYLTCLWLLASQGYAHALERQRIIKALEQATGQVGGPSGAAVRLGLKRTTLQNRIQKMQDRAPVSLTTAKERRLRSVFGFPV